MNGSILWLRRALGGYSILITYRLVPPDKFIEELYYRKVSTSQAYAMGYVRGYKIKDEAKYMPFKIFVRFEPDTPPLPLPQAEINGDYVDCRETASSFYDQVISKSVERFLSGMKAVTIPSIDIKKIGMIAAIAAAAAIGLAYIFLK